jgi:hypothetical protein
MVLPLGQKMDPGATAPQFICFNHLIRLQAVGEIVTNETTRALNFLAKQSTKMCNAMHQNCLALDYLLASKGGVCRKFNLSNCCLQIDDEGKVMEEITDRLGKIAHVPIQTWRGWNACLEDGSLPWFSFGFKTLIGATGLILGACFNITLPGSLSVVVYYNHYGGHYRKKTATHIMRLWKYKPLNQDDAL